MPLKKEQVREIEDETKPITNADKHPPAQRPARIWDLPPMPDYDPEQQAIIDTLADKEFITEGMKYLVDTLAMQPTGKGYVLTRTGWREVEPVTIAAEPPRQRSVHVMGMGSGRQEGKKVKRY